MPDRTCSIDGCDKPHRARDLCAVHYNTQYSPTKKVLRACTVCGAMVEKGQTVKRRPVCSQRCQNYLHAGHWPEDGKELVGPVERRRILRPAPKPRPTKVRFVATSCDWCGAGFIHDLRITGADIRWCSLKCQRKAHKVGRRALEAGATGSYTWAEVMHIYLAIGKRCAYCGRTGQEIESDHVIPLSRGGSNSLTNVVPACKSCNSSKNAWTLAEWYERRAELGLPPVELNPSLTHLTHVLLSA
jgi:5-methylcytosine-specific restriction endonuclease McrA